MKSLLQTLAPVHHELMQVAVEHVTEERLAGDYAGEQFAPAKSELQPDDPLLTLLGNRQLIAIAGIDRELALGLKLLLDQLEEADFADACETENQLSHRIRTHYLGSLADREGVAR